MQNGNPRTSFCIVECAQRLYAAEHRVTDDSKTWKYRMPILPLKKMTMFQQAEIERCLTHQDEYIKRRTLATN